MVESAGDLLLLFRLCVDRMVLQAAASRLGTTTDSTNPLTAEAFQKALKR